MSNGLNRIGMLLLANLFMGIAMIAISADPPNPGAAGKARGRLPVHFKDVVTDSQRQRIYAIQAKYDAEIDGLAARIKRLQAEQTKEIEGILEPDQLAKLKRLRAAADLKKKKGIDPIDAADAKDGDEAK